MKTSFGLVEAVKISDDGSLPLPEAFRDALRLSPGTHVIVCLSEEGGLRVLSREEGIRMAQEILAPYRDPEHPASEELIRERRAEAARE